MSREVDLLVSRGAPPEATLAAAIGLVELESDAASARAFELVLSLPPEEIVWEPFVDALRLTTSDRIQVHAKAAFAAATNSGFRAGAIPFLVERGFLQPSDLVGVLDDPNDQVAIAATLALGWSGALEHVSTVRDRLGTRTPECVGARLEALLFASVALGDRSALAEIRRLVQAGDAGLIAIDAMVVAGDASDAERLLNLAQRDDAAGRRAICGAGHLGNPACLPGLKQIDRPGCGPLIQQALAALIGDAPVEQAPTGVARMLRGRPWSIAGALERLSAVDQPLCSRDWIALELSVRTGLRFPSPVLPGASTDLIAEAIAVRKAAIASVSRSLDGGWPYFGSHRPPAI